MGEKICLKCGNTGIMNNGEPCDCRANIDIDLPVVLSIPEQYQTADFNKTMLPKYLQFGYGTLCEEIISSIRVNKRFNKNVLICAPPNSGKTVFSYTVYRILHMSNVPVPPILDLFEIRRMLANVYNEDEDLKLLKSAKTAIVRVQLDLPPKFVEYILSILEFRVRYGGFTIFLYDGSYVDMMNADRGGKLKYIKGDGSYHTVEVHSYFNEEEEDGKV